MVLSPTERNLVHRRKHKLRTSTIRLQIVALLLRIQKPLEKYIQELESEKNGEEIRD
jgi:hypothetical protein